MRSSIKARIRAIEEKLNQTCPKRDLGYYFYELGEEIDELKYLKKELSKEYSSVYFLPVVDPAVMRLKTACVKYGELTKNYSRTYPLLTDDVLAASHEYLRAVSEVRKKYTPTLL
jgi:hypothetical protein